MLTVTETLPADIEPLRLRREASPSGTKAILVGYPQDRAFAMTADRDCELLETINAGRIYLHTCRGIKGYSGGPILVSAGDGKMQIAGIQIAIAQHHGMDRMIAVPAQAIWRQDRDVMPELPLVVADAGVTTDVCAADVAAGRDGLTLGSGSMGDGSVGCRFLHLGHAELGRDRVALLPASGCRCAVGSLLMFAASLSYRSGIERLRDCR